jgi:hypothetical protein
MGELVREHGGELVARRRDADEAEVHADVAARQREGVDARVADEERLPGEARVQVGRDVAEGAAARHQRRPDGLEVLEQERVVEVVRVDPDLPHDLVAELALGGDGEIGGVAVAERRQRALCRRHRRQRAAQCHRDGEDRGEEAAPGHALPIMPRSR